MSVLAFAKADAGDLAADPCLDGDGGVGIDVTVGLDLEGDILPRHGPDADGNRLGARRRLLPGAAPRQREGCSSGDGAAAGDSLPALQRFSCGAAGAGACPSEPVSWASCDIAR